MTDSKRKEIRPALRKAVDIAPSEMERWLDAQESQSVGWRREGDDEAVGHRSGRRILELKRRTIAELSVADCAHMRKLVGYKRRHKAQRPQGDVTETRWRFSPMNWGYDPLKDS